MKAGDFYREIGGRRDILKLLYRNDARKEWTFEFVYGWAGRAAIAEDTLKSEFEPITIAEVKAKVVNYEDTPV